MQKLCDAHYKHARDGPAVWGAYDARLVANHRIWAPWRLQYIKSDKTDECIFCAKPAAGDDRANLIVHRGERCFVMLNAFPYTSGHVMVAPYEHTARLDELAPATAAEVMELAQRSVRAIDSAYGP
jgi:ATP adenylyltransferase